MLLLLLHEDEGNESQTSNTNNLIDYNQINNIKNNLNKQLGIFLYDKTEGSKKKAKDEIKNIMEKIKAMNLNKVPNNVELDNLEKKLVFETTTKKKLLDK
jgi:transcriptional regulator of heat shock response